MNYTVLARKYRPQTFDDVVAQEHVTRTLRNALKNNRIGSGYLFCGPRGTGKTTVARILAKAVNCVNGPTQTPCGECPACKEITAGSSLDVLEIDAASNTGVDDVRTLRENVRYLPTNGKKRIYIIDEVHRLSGAAFDALLKTLEEPPPHVMFVFATTEPTKVPETILSRTQRYDFRRVSVDELTSHLRTIAQREHLTIDDAALHLLARKADGSVRDSLSLMDQITAFAGDTIGEQDVVAALGLVDRQFLFDFVNAVAEADGAKALHLTKRLFDAGVDVADFVSELLDHFRTLLVLSSGPESAELLPLGSAELAEYQKQAQNYSVGDLLRLIKIASEVIRDLKDGGLDERLLLEVASVRMADMESTVRLEEVLKALSALPIGAASGAAGPGGVPDFFPAAPLRKDEVPAAAGPRDVTTVAAEALAQPSRTLNLAQVHAGWEGFLTDLRHTNPMLASQVRMAEIKSVKDNQVTLLYFASGETSMQLVLKVENLNATIRALREHFKANVTLKVEIDRSKEHPNPPLAKGEQPKVDIKKLVEESPRLKQLIDKVDGEVIGVKKVQ
ncbi:MAG: DNA polymerase III subunit gamma/tau [Candidatus Zixiibacteriota bacterium]